MNLPFSKDTLPNGVRIVTQKVSGVRSSSLGIWIGTGSRNEQHQERGSAHFIEHMVFKGTQRRTARDLAQEIDAIGGQVNAYTSKEVTCFYAHCLDEHLHQAIDILCDMMFESKFNEEDVNTERGVILEEIKMYEDNPEDLCGERLLTTMYGDSPMAHSILGTPETLSNMSGQTLKAYKEKHYRPDCIVVALAGSFDPVVVESLKARFAGIVPREAPPLVEARYHAGLTLLQQSHIEQTHINLAFQGVDYHSPRRYEIQLLSSILGGGMSSRLFQEVREQLGLCYAIYSYGASNQDTGMLSIYTALDGEMQIKALEAITQILEDLTQHGVTQTELNRARELTKANVLMGLESTQARMNHIGRGTLLQDQILTPQEVLDAYNRVTLEDLLKLSQETFVLDQSVLSIVGHPKEEDVYRKIQRSLK